jgi:sensor histidine kinase YesM
MRVVICNIAALLSDMAAWSFDGDTSAHGFVIVRVAKFLNYSLSYFMISFLADYITVFIGRNAKINKNMTRIMYMLCAVAVLLVFVSQFNLMYYGFDQYNRYQVGELFWLSQVFGVLFLLFITVVILKYKKSIGTNDTLFLLSYAFFPILAMILQTVVRRDLELVFVASTLSIITSYGGVQIRQAKLLKDRELELTESRMAIMMSQIQPHFLYNSLVVIRHLCRENPKLAEETVVEFAQYLRGNLDSLALKNPIPFEQELQHTQMYLAIEQKRFGYKLKVIYDIRFKDFSLPALTLQPIAENAVQYGVTKKEHGGTVTVTSEEVNGKAVITVIDDGVGFITGQPAQDGRSHVGIENVRSRLAALCGGTLDIKSKPGEGTTAVITIPLKGISV